MFLLLYPYKQAEISSTLDKSKKEKKELGVLSISMLILTHFAYFQKGAFPTLVLPVFEKSMV